MAQRRHRPPVKRQGRPHNHRQRQQQLQPADKTRLRLCRPAEKHIVSHPREHHLVEADDHSDRQAHEIAAVLAGDRPFEWRRAVAALGHRPLDRFARRLAQIECHTREVGEKIDLDPPHARLVRHQCFDQPRTRRANHPCDAM